MNAKFFCLFALTTLVSAQSSESPSVSGSATPIPSGPFTACVQSCIDAVAPTVGCDPLEKSCFCSESLESAAVPCIAQCSPEDQASIMALAQRICATADTSNPSSSSPGTTTDTTTTDTTTTITTTTSSSVVLSSTSITTTISISSALSSPATETPIGANASLTTNAAFLMTARSSWAMAAVLLGFAVRL